MIEIKKDATTKVPVRIVDLLDNPVVGIVAADVDVSIAKSTAAIVSYVPTAPQWTELTTDAFLNEGVYFLTIPNTYTDVAGPTIYSVQVAGCRTYVGAIKIVANEEVDTYTLVDRLGAVVEGKWEIVRVGPDINRLVLYNKAGAAAIQKWDLFDKDGLPTCDDAVYMRVPTIAIP